MRLLSLLLKGHLLQFPIVKVILEYIKGVWSEMTKVVWPKKEEVARLTLLVFITSGIVAAYVGVLDFSFTKLLELVVVR